MDVPALVNMLCLHSACHLPSNNCSVMIRARSEGCVTYREGNSVPTKPPWHSVKINARQVYHDNGLCTEGDNIDAQYRRNGTGGRPRCHHCTVLAQQGR
jgi:hypothetical protein